MSDGGGAGEVLNPVQLEVLIHQLANDIARGVRAVSTAEQSKVNTERIYDHAYAVAFMAHEGPQTEKKYAAEKNTQEERVKRDVAYVAYRHAERQMKALETQLSSAQSVLKSAVAMYGAGGSGRGQ